MSSLLITGATGRMAKGIRPYLTNEFNSIRLYSRRKPELLHPNESSCLGTLEDLDQLQKACEDIDVIVHLGGKADESTFDEIMSSNILGTYNVFEAARRSGVQRVVYASSHHVTGFHDVTEDVSEKSEVRPDTYYGVSKVFGEAVARLYHDKWGLEVVCLRIGVCRPEPENSDQLRTWLSIPDSMRLILGAATHQLADGFAVVYGLSDNSRAFWHSPSASKIGFTPKDSADVFVEDFAPIGEFSTRYQGGAFTGRDYRGGTW